MLNFYKFYNKTGLNNEEYNFYISKFKSGGQDPNDLKPIVHIIKKTPTHAYWYAFNFMKCRWIEAEPIIMKSPRNAYYYAKDILKRRWLEAEPYIMKDPYAMIWYAKYIMKHRWYLAEDNIRDNKELWKLYCDKFNI